MSLSVGSMSSGSVHGLFPVCAGRMVTAGAARFGRRTPGPHVWPAAPLQFMRGDGWRGAAMSHQSDAAERFARGECVFLHEMIPVWAPEELEKFVVTARMVQRFGGFEKNRNDDVRRVLKTSGIIEGEGLPPGCVWPNEGLARVLKFDWELAEKWKRLDEKIREILVQPNVRTGFIDTRSEYGDVKECHHRMWAHRHIGMPHPDAVDANYLFLEGLKVFGKESRQTWCAAEVEVRGEQKPVSANYVEPVAPELAVRQGKRGFDDNKLLEKMKAELESKKYPNLWQAVCAFAAEADGRGTIESKEKRLEKKFKEKYPKEAEHFGVHRKRPRSS
ncbi:hypothetical protein [Gluconobacter albidus]|nr:hypothetical protein [Gluconobacter albidus]